MKFVKMFGRKKKPEASKIVDFYQASINKIGREQIQKLVDRGLSIHIVML